MLKAFVNLSADPEWQAQCNLSVGKKPLQKSTDATKVISAWGLIRTWLVFRTMNSIYDGLPVVKYLCYKRKLGLLSLPDRTGGRAIISFISRREGSAQ